MKSGPIFVAIAALIVVGGITYAFVRDGAQRDAEESGSAAGPEMATPVVGAIASEDTPVQVDDLAAAPDSFKGDVMLKGVVSGVNKEDSVFALIDAREYESCGVLTCAKYVVPVKFNGQLPAAKTIVNVEGRIVRNDKGLVFEAKQVQAQP